MKPITLVVPWDALVPDNRKHTVARGRIILTSQYTKAKRWINEIAYNERLRRRGVPLRCRVALHAVLYEPNESRVRDVSNFAKLVQDGLKGQTYLDDGQIDDARWMRGPVDKANPRMEITLSPLPETPEP